VSWTTYAGAGALVERDGRVLMVRQRRHYGTHWELPSGYVEAGESFEQAAAREVLEEAAIAVEIGKLLCTMLWEREHDRRRNLLAFFLATAVDPGAEPRPQTEEDIDEAAFLDLPAVERPTCIRSTGRSSTVVGRPRDRLPRARTCPPRAGRDALVRLLTGRARRSSRRRTIGSWSSG
jgi:ADP-ribose pyrophosphatase YjhB (NUDIX family)